MSSQRPAVFLDRDGVLNRALVRNGKPYPPATIEELEVLPGVVEGLATLREAGFLLIVVTNQPDVARKTQTREAIEEMHARLLEELQLDEIVACYEDGDDCPDRKPNPGMLLKAAARHDVALEESFMVGDRWRDIEAGCRAGCRTVLIDYAYDERSPSLPPDFITANLVDASAWIVDRSRKERSHAGSLRSQD